MNTEFWYAIPLILFLIPHIFKTEQSYYGSDIINLIRFTVYYSIAFTILIIKLFVIH